MERYRLMEWLSFINSEVHKGFSPLFREDAPQDTKDYMRKKLAERLDYLHRALGSKSFVMGEQYTVADPYLFTVLSWGAYVNVDIGRWPQLKRFVERIGARPLVIEALNAEGHAK
jgi:glutathione S-transferase